MGWLCTARPVTHLRRAMLVAVTAALALRARLRGDGLRAHRAQSRPTDNWHEVGPVRVSTPGPLQVATLTRRQHRAHSPRCPRGSSACRSPPRRRGPGSRPSGPPPSTLLRLASVSPPPTTASRCLDPQTPMLRDCSSYRPETLTTSKSTTWPRAISRRLRIRLRRGTRSPSAPTPSSMLSPATRRSPAGASSGMPATSRPTAARPWLFPSVPGLSSPTSAWREAMYLSSTSEIPREGVWGAAGRLAKPPTAKKPPAERGADDAEIRLPGVSQSRSVPSLVVVSHLRPFLSLFAGHLPTRSL